MRVRVKILWYRSREENAAAAPMLAQFPRARATNPTWHKRIYDARFTTRWIRLGIPARAIDSIKCTLLWAKFTFLLPSSFSSIRKVSHRKMRRKSCEKTTNYVWVTRWKSVRCKHDLEFLFIVHVAINMHFILIWLYFMLNARSRMNYNHLEGQEARALNNHYRENYGGALALLP